MKEPELIKRCLRNDKQAWSLFVEKYSRLVYWAIHKRLKASSFRYDQGDIDDIFQEIFVILFEKKKLAQLRNIKFIVSWLAMLASNKTTEVMLCKVRKSAIMDFQEGFSHDPGIEQELLGQDIAALVRGALDGLNDKERVIISLNLLEGRMHKEISFMLNIPINTVSSLILRTKQKLAKILAEMGIRDYL